MHQLSGLSNRLPKLRNLFAGERSLLLPMTVLALGIHAALLALPIPSNEALKTPDDQKNPIKVTQIPTEKLPEVASSTGVTIPPLGTSSAPATASSPSPSDSASSTSDASDSSDADDSSSTSSDTAAVTPSKPAAVSPIKKATKSTVTKASAKPSGDSDSSDRATEPTPSSAGDTAETGAPTADTADTAISSSTVSGGGLSATAFTNFPQFKSSTGDCFGLGLGDNCRVVENGAIAEVTNYFRKELAAKQFKAELVTDEPTRKVFKVTKENKTLFLNILQSKQSVVYLLSSVMYKQSPDTITEKGQ